MLINHFLPKRINNFFMNERISQLAQIQYFMNALNGIKNGINT